MSVSFARVALATLLVLLGAASSAAAHGYVVGGAPEPFGAVPVAPERAAVFFSEAVEVDFSSVRVFDKDSQLVSTGRAFHPDGDASRLAVRLAPLSNGTYTVVWKALWRSDGHETGEFYPFTVGEKPAVANYTPPANVTLTSGDTGPTVASSLFRTLGFAGILLVPGSLAYHLLIFHPAWRRAAGGRERIFDEGIRQNRRVSFAIAWFGLFLAGAGTIGLLADLAATTLDVAGIAAVLRIPEAMASTTVGKVLGLRFLFVVLAAFDLVLAHRVERTAWLSLGFALAALVTTSFASHAGGVGGSVLVADVVHLLAASAWAGALPAVAFALPRAARVFDAPERDRLYAPLVAAFSTLATVSIGAIVITGTWSAAAHIASWSDVVTTRYGQLLLLKLALVAPVLLLGVLNRMVFAPGFQPDARRKLGGLAKYVTPGRFRRVLVAEVILVAGILAVTGILAGTAARELEPTAPPAGTIRDGPLILEGPGRDTVFARVVLDPGELGANGINATFRHMETGAALNVTVVRIALNYRTNPEFGNSQEELTRDNETGAFTGRTGFGLPGDYDLVVLVEQADAYPDAVIFKLSVPEAGPIIENRNPEG